VILSFARRTCLLLLECISLCVFKRKMSAVTAQSVVSEREREREGGEEVLETGR